MSDDMLKRLLDEMDIETLRSLAWVLATTHERGKSLVADYYAQQEKF